MTNRIPLWMAALALAAALAGAGCSLFDDDDARPLVGPTWQLRAFLAEDAFPPGGEALCALDGVDCVDTGRTYTVGFRTGGLGVRADCNTCSGLYDRDGASLRVNQLVCTEAACPPGSRGPAFAQALGAARGYQIRGAWLLVAYGDGRGLLLRATSQRAVSLTRSR